MDVGFRIVIVFLAAFIFVDFVVDFVVVVVVVVVDADLDVDVIGRGKEDGAAGIMIGLLSIATICFCCIDSLSCSLRS